MHSTCEHGVGFDRYFFIRYRSDGKVKEEGLDWHTLHGPMVARTGDQIEEPILGPKQDHLRWSRFKETAPEQMFGMVKV
ncbi:hypothetical protein [Desulfosediminicola ganghwensis]|uniref:hypothetical protein n=1 Tax=Desulfosediminicola ganghwensis TaxID=2569540 RepID=UPI0010AD1CCB|nr:hypothetical protein [Desulfosediminicola ganghwensis]